MVSDRHHHLGSKRAPEEVCKVNCCINSIISMKKNATESHVMGIIVPISGECGKAWMNSVQGHGDGSVTICEE